MIIWIVFAFVGGEWFEMKDSFADKSGCLDKINVPYEYYPNKAGTMSKRYIGTEGSVFYDPGYPHTLASYPAVCRSRRVAAPPQ